jgi:hypothetical protein
VLLHYIFLVHWICGGLQGDLWQSKTTVYTELAYSRILKKIETMNDILVSAALRHNSNVPLGFVQRRFSEFSLEVNLVRHMDETESEPTNLRFLTHFCGLAVTFGLRTALSVGRHCRRQCIR